MSAQPDPFVIPAKAGIQGLGASYDKGSSHCVIVS